ncbi:SAM-dependent methyltransferase [Nonomuraea insulae]|uniref:SAM-dependent methyltransferase n=1 Tax=Nonomuraea insulae TaxID=1616787 RepID=A0ABW1D8M6_9ACTN
MNAGTPAVTPQSQKTALSVVAVEREIAPAGVDPTVPNVARMHNYFLSGKDSFAADRALGDEVEKTLPEGRTAVIANRSFLGRAARKLAEENGITQFADLGSGLPTTRNVDEIAQSVNPDARVVYVDFEPQVASHGHALLASDGRVPTYPRFAERSVPVSTRRRTTRSQPTAKPAQAARGPR